VEIIKADRMACFTTAKPRDISDDQWEQAKTHATVSGNKLSAQSEDAAFYFFLLGDTWEDIAVRLNLPIGLLLYTCLNNKWHEKRTVLTKTASKNKLQKADQAAMDLLTDSVVATTAIYKSQITAAMRDPANAANCPFIPKNFKELQTLLQLLKMFQGESINGNQPNISFNIANMVGTSQAKTQVASTATPDMLEAEMVQENPEEVQQDRKRVLELLKLVKEEQR
jgi:hypothetical protein